jgi:hypothetical protein
MSRILKDTEYFTVYKEKDYIGKLEPTYRIQIKGRKMRKVPSLSCEYPFFNYSITNLPYEEVSPLLDGPYPLGGELHYVLNLRYRIKSPSKVYQETIRVEKPYDDKDKKVGFFHPGLVDYSKDFIYARGSDKDLPPLLSHEVGHRETKTDQRLVGASDFLRELAAWEYSFSSLKKANLWSPSYKDTAIDSLRSYASLNPELYSKVEEYVELLDKDTN